MKTTVSIERLLSKRVEQNSIHMIALLMIPGWLAIPFVLKIHFTIFTEERGLCRRIMSICNGANQK